MEDGNSKSKVKLLQEMTLKNASRLVDTELKVALTMIQVAQTETQRGDHPHARRLLEKAERAMQSVRQQVANHRISTDENQEIEKQMQELTKSLHAARRRISKAPHDGQDGNA